MKNRSFFNSRSFKYGSMSVLITALVIAAIIVFNVIFSALGAKYGWYMDLTREQIYTLSDTCVELLDETFEKVDAEREEPVKVKIKFCDLEDNLMANTTQRYVLMTAKELAQEFPDKVEIEYVNIWENPTAVEPYKTSAVSKIFSSNIIIESGSEYRVYSIDKFYLTNANSTTPWAYFGEKRFASAILAVTQAEAPIAAVLSGHRENFANSSLIEVLDLAGYKVIEVKDLVNEELPENCRLIVCYNPTSDFMDAGSIADEKNSEIKVLESFLADNNHSFMVFMNPSSPRLPVLEGYLELWGVSFMRKQVDKNLYHSYTVKDSSNALTGDGLTFISEYETLGLGASITKDLRSTSVPRKVIFKNAMPIEIAPEYDIRYAEENGISLKYGFKAIGSGAEREIYHIFKGSQKAVGMLNGTEALKSTATEKLGLMTISRQSRLVQEDNIGFSHADLSSYVIACGSTDFVSEAILNSATYGNSEFLLNLFYETGKENIPASLPITPFSDTTIDTLTVDRANAYTLMLTAIPAVIVFGLGIFVIVRRKHS
ncbi:MAG: Gldg family protein [Clostridia bacterium]|nr:Gldg family protein [Clostridia bacterium]